MKPSILVAILHYGSSALTYRCLEQLLNKDQMEVLVIDNDPKNIFRPLGKKYSNLKIIKTNENLGFGKSNNFGIQYIKKSYHKYILLLNNDVVISEFAITQMVKELENLKAGIVGPCIYFSDNPNIIWACGGYVRKFNFEIRGYNFKITSSPYSVDYIPGAVLLTTIKLWEEIGGLPENYFLGYEEAEFALSASKLGYKIMALPNIKVLHDVGMSSEKKSKKYIYNYYRNKFKLSKYYLGPYVGMFYIAIVTFFENLIVNPKDSDAWLRALYHEISGKELSYKTVVQDFKN